MGLDDEVKYLVFNYEDDVEEYFQTAKTNQVQMYLTTNEITSLSHSGVHLPVSYDSSRKFVYLVEEANPANKYWRVYLDYVVKSEVAEVEEFEYEPE